MYIGYIHYESGFVMKTQRKELILIAAYDLCHPQWSKAVIQQEIRRCHNIEVFSLPKNVKSVSKNEVSIDQVKAHRKKSEYLILNVPERRGRKRKVDDDDVAKKKMIRRELKKRKSSPFKAAKRLSANPKFPGTISRASIYRSMCVNGKRQGDFLLISFHC